MKITFLGGVEEVTGSKYLIEHKVGQEDIKILVDCGLFQGPHEVAKRNWYELPIDPSEIDAIVITHAHIDHTGYIPAFVKKGFRGKIYCSHATLALCRLLLVDSGNLQEGAVKSKYAQSNQQEPLYTVADAQYSLRFFEPVDYDTQITIGGSLHVTLIRSDHILGSNFVVISDGNRTLTFSGDLGRPEDLIMKSPPHLKNTDYLVLESTYGDRLHKKTDPIHELGELIQETVARQGVVIIPVFAVGRAQTVLYCLYQLKEKGIISDIPIFLDSPMAIEVTELFCQFQDEHKLPVSLCNKIFDIAEYTRTVDESKAIDHVQPPMIIIAGSGMGDGGRAPHHFKRFISDAKNRIIFAGYQAMGTPGRALVEGAGKIKIDENWYPVRAQVNIIDSFSAHADFHEILAWLSYFESKPKKVFITHGELASAQSLKEKVQDKFGWDVVVPKYLESFDLD
jgi:metallo-beta-lactamase family protein